MTLNNTTWSVLYPFDYKIVSLFIAIQPGQHPRELNPFWKEGGSGLPTEKGQTTQNSMSDNQQSGELIISLMKGCNNPPKPVPRFYHF